MLDHILPWKLPLPDKAQSMLSHITALMARMPKSSRTIAPQNDTDLSCDQTKSSTYWMRQFCDDFFVWDLKTVQMFIVNLYSFEALLSNEGFVESSYHGSAKSNPHWLLKNNRRKQLIISFQITWQKEVWRGSKKDCSKQFNRMKKF